MGGVRWKNRKRSGRVLVKVFGIDVGICYLDPLVRAKLHTLLANFVSINDLSKWLLGLEL